MDDQREEALRNEAIYCPLPVVQGPNDVHAMDIILHQDPSSLYVPNISVISTNGPLRTQRSNLLIGIAQYLPQDLVSVLAE
jgi:hypothetical protein